jgi:peptide/nickel transport system permease protein
MTAFILRRLLSLIPMLFGITLLVFLLMSIAPGDFLTPLRNQRDIPQEMIDRLVEEFGLDQPWYVQYLSWLKNLLTLDIGESWTYKMPVAELLWQRVPATLLLSITSLVFAWVIALPLGILAAIYKDSWFDRISSGLAYAAFSVPEFFLAQLAVFFAARTGWFPLGGMTSFEHDFLSTPAQILDIGHHLILPTIVLGIGGVASLMRIMRSNFLDSIRMDYVMTARAKGVPEGVVMFKHVLRNAINPFITMLGFALSGLLSGALLVESVMNYPGLGQLMYQAFLREDRFVVLGAVVLSSVLLVIGNLVADILLAVSDPRIRHGK